jgi:histidine triad (HIT) family protein
MSYDPNNIFARILKGEIPCKKAHESEHALAFEDISPQAPIHTLVIPKGAYESVMDFADSASDAEIAGLFRAIAATARAKGVEDDGFRLICNNGRDGRQEVPHLHFHVMGGRQMGRMVPKPKPENQA